MIVVLEKFGMAFGLLMQGPITSVTFRLVVSKLYFPELSTPFARGQLRRKLTSGGLTVTKLSCLRLETVIIRLGLKYRLVPLSNPPTLKLTVLRPLLKQHPSRVGRKVLAPVETKDVCTHLNKLSNSLFFTHTAMRYVKKKGQSNTHSIEKE